MSRRHRRAKRARMQAILNLVSVYYVSTNSNSRCYE